MIPPTTPDPIRKRWNEIEAILDVVLDAEPSRWPDLLDEVCGDDAGLRREVEDLLRRHERSRDFLGTPAAELASEILTAPEAAEAGPSVQGLRIGAYRVVREIGRGGMGRVFLAERAEGDFEQRVALKLLRPGLDEPDSERRFRSERRILASLEHSSIARLLDGGVTAEGSSWLAMEYVEGSPIDEYCEARALTVRQRLDLFLALTSAVQYAHRNLVVHRDLKPSNIQITPDGELKLLDFGIAKLLPESDGEAAALTRPGQRFLTPEYSAPEQVRGESVTTATDVYQLGVVLYELLTGRRPFEGEGGGLHELEQAILEREPEKPSTAASRPGEEGARPRTARSTRGTAGPGIGASPDRLRRMLSGDLDAIVLKALRKDPELRYASAGEMGADVRRYLAGLPVLAHEGSRVYRLRKLIRRHRWGLGVAAGFVLLLAGFGTVYTARVTDERDRARLEAEKSAQVTGFLMGLFEANDPRESRGDSITARDLLVRGLEQVGTLREQPEVQAQMLDVLGRVYHSLGQYDRAQPLLERALASRRGLPYGDPLDVAHSLANLASLLKDRGDYDPAERLSRQALSIRRDRLGEEHLDVAQSLDGLGGILAARGEYRTAERLSREALAMRRALLGEEHADVATSMNNLGLLLMEMGEYEEAEALHGEALAMRRTLLGDEHLDVTYSLNNLALVLHYQGRYEDAEPLYREVMALDRKLLGEDHPDYALDLNNLGGLLAARGDLDGAEALHREALAIYRESLGPTHPRIAQSLNNLAGLLYRRDDFEGAEPLYREALAMRRELLGEDHPAVATILGNLGALSLKTGEYEEAEAVFREAVRITTSSPGGAEWGTAYYRSGLGASLTGLARYAEAETVLLEAHSALREERGDRDAYTESALERIVALYEDWGKPDEAARFEALRTPSTP